MPKPTHNYCGLYKPDRDTENDTFRALIGLLCDGPHKYRSMMVMVELIDDDDDEEEVEDRGDKCTLNDNW